MAPSSAAKCGLRALGAGVAVDFGAERELDDLGSFPGHRSLLGLLVTR
jgi:hypothetical protein